MDAYESANESNITSEWLQALVDKFHHPETFAKKSEPGQQRMQVLFYHGRLYNKKAILTQSDKKGYTYLCVH